MENITIKKSSKKNNNLYKRLTKCLKIHKMGKARDGEHEYIHAKDNDFFMTNGDILIKFCKTDLEVEDGSYRYFYNNNKDLILSNDSCCLTGSVPKTYENIDKNSTADKIDFNIRKQPLFYGIKNRTLSHDISKIMFELAQLKIIVNYEYLALVGSFIERCKISMLENSIFLTNDEVKILIVKIKN